ncbi:MAG: hypothetical protein WCC59_05200 [Terriglobales bacterium]
MAYTVKSLKPIKAQLENGIEMVELYPGKLYLVRINKIPIADAQKLQQGLAEMGMRTVVVDQTAEVYEIIENPALQAPTAHPPTLEGK